MTGKYAEAAEQFTPAAKDAEGAIGLTRAKSAVGRDDEARRALASTALDGNADIRAERAWLAWRRGDPKEASLQVDAALHLKDDQLLARYLRGAVLEDSGRWDEAEKAYRWLVEYYNSHDVTAAESLRWIGLAAAKYARWNRAHDQFDFLVNELYPEALKRDPLYWPAHYEAGLLYQEKYNESEALRQFQAALAINPNAAEVHAAMAVLALEHRRIDAAEASLARARAIHPRLPETEMAAAELAWANFDDAQAAEILKTKVLAWRPGWEPALGRLAAVVLLSEPASFDVPASQFSALRKQASARNPAPAEFYLALGDALVERSKLALGERFLQEAQRCCPKMVGPATARGLAAMRQGDEARARQLLRDARAADPFNVRVKNSLEVLALLDGYKTIEGRHVIVKYDPARDKVLARYAAPYLEEAYPKLCAELGFTPPKKPIVEIFNEAKGNRGHHWFGARMVGLPYLGAVAASTGHIVGVTSPNDAGAKAHYNWARVLRHELVHVITLQQTDFNMPHWYTEGLAVRAEQSPRPMRWNRLLAERVPSGDLLSLATINFAFTRPSSSDQWQLAYCQAELYVEYMVARHGVDVLGKLSNAFATTPAVPEALRKATGANLPEFEAGYREYLVKTAKSLPAEPWIVKEKLSAVEKAAKARPKDAAAAARLAYVRMLRGEDDAAESAAKVSLSLDAGDTLAKYVLARVLIRRGKTAEALARLDGCLNPKQPNLKVLNLQAGLLVKLGRAAEAKSLYAQAAALDPLNPQWLQAQLRACAAMNDAAATHPLLERLANLDPDDFDSRKRLVALCLAKKDLQGAAKWANQAVQIDVKDSELHCLFAEIWRAGNNLSSAIEEYQFAIEVEPDSPAALAARKALLALAEKTKAQPTPPKDEVPRHPQAKASP